MTRARLGLRYGDRSAAKAPEGSLDPEVAVPGFYRHKLRSGGMPVGVRIWFGPPLDPESGEEMDRSPRMQAAVNGKYVELAEVWPRCGGDPITQAEHDHLVSLQAWGAENGHDAIADPRKKLDGLRTPLLF